MNPDRPLLFTPRAQSGESPLSLLRRGALGNGHSSTSRFAFALNPKLDHSTTALGTVARAPESLGATFEAMGLTLEQTEQVAYRRVGRSLADDIEWNGLRVGVSDLQFHRAKLCVACYCENGFASSEWDHVAAVACAKHQVLLDDACPCCGDSWTPDNDPLACGCNPREMAARQERCSRKAASVLDQIIRNADQAGLSILTGVRSALQSWRAFGVQLSRAVMANALWSLSSGRWPAAIEGLLTRNSVMIHPRVALAPLLADRGPECVTAAQPLLRRKGPNLIAENLNRVWWPASTVMAVLGTKRVPFEKLMHAGHLVARADGRYAALAINELLWRVSGCRKSGAQMKPLAAHRAGPDPQSLASLVTKIRAGVITSYYCPVETGLEGLMCEETPGLVSPPTVLGLKEVAKRLGTNSESVRSVIRLGLLDGGKGTPRSSVEWSVDGKSLQLFEDTYVFASAVAKQHGGSVQTIASRLRSAGLIAVSGPDVDGGVTYLFDRSHVSMIDISSTLREPYRSPAGRKKKGSSPQRTGLLSSHEASAILGITVRQLREVVRAGWIAPFAVVTRRRMFGEAAVLELKRALAEDYVSIQEAATDMEQTIPQFYRTWVGSKTVVAHRFLERTLILIDDLDRISEMWRDIGTSTSVGRTLNRPRWLCPNLEKMARMPPPTVIGSGTSKVRLYSRAAPSLDKYKMI